MGIFQRSLGEPDDGPWGSSRRARRPGAYTDCNITYFNGLIDDVRVYDRALSPEEIRELALF